MSATATLRAEAPRPGRVLTAVRTVASLAVLMLGACAMLIVALLTAFRLRRLYSERLATPLGRAVLRIWRVRYIVHAPAGWPPGQVVYVSNHSSTIDMFVLIALGLPNARFFLSGYLRALLPLGLIGYLIGIFWTVPQEYPERRRQIFSRAARLLKRTGESVYLSPEGSRITDGTIGPFNKGAFHLATDLCAPIVPLYIAIPLAIDPGKGIAAGAGLVHVHVLPAVDTRGWRVEDVDKNRDAVRRLYAEHHARARITAEVQA
jgi:1-acyl-sn-glycerol-3-phosphate acyltransferase